MKYQSIAHLFVPLVAGRCGGIDICSQKHRYVWHASIYIQASLDVLGSRYLLAMGDDLLEILGSARYLENKMES